MYFGYFCFKDPGKQAGLLGLMCQSFGLLLQEGDDRKREHQKKAARPEDRQPETMKSTLISVLTYF